MIFIPCYKSYSHRPDEFSTEEQMRKGVETLALTMAKLSRESSSIDDVVKNTPNSRFSFPTRAEKEKEKEAENEVAIIREIPRWKNDAVRTTSCDAEKNEA